MNYIWDTVIKAAWQGIASEKITFAAADSFSPYIEVAFENINTVSLDQTPTVEINPYYRFVDIFVKLTDSNLSGNEELRAVLFDIVTHYLLFLDVKQGLCKYEYYAKYIRQDLEQGVFGSELKDSISAFTIDEFHTVVRSMITLHETHASVYLFKQIVRRIFINSIIYYRSEEKPEVLIYLGTYETEITSQKIRALLALFLPLGFAFRLYWEKHFGIIDMEQTMGIENIIIY